MAKQMYLPKDLPRMIWYFARLKIWWLIAIFTTTFVFAALSSYVSYALKEVVDALTTVKKESYWQDMTPSCLFFIACYLGVCVSLRLRNLSSLFFYPSLNRSMTMYLHQLLQKRSLHYYQDQMSGGIANRVIELKQGTAVIIEQLTKTWFVFVLLSVYLYLLWHASVYFAVVFFIWLCIYIPFMLYYSVKAKDLAYKFATSQTNLMGLLVDNISNMYFVKLFARQFYEHSRIDDASTDVFVNDRALQRNLMGLRAFGDIMLVLLMSVNVYLLLFLYQRGEITSGIFVFVVDTTVEISWYVWDYFAEQCLRMVEEYGKCQQALTLLHAPWQTQDDDDAKHLVVSDATIEFDNITYGHDNRSNLFNNFQLTIAPGERVGLVGYSGSGKTTLMQLLLRFFSIQEGGIYIDGQNIKHVTLDSLRQHIVMVPQDSQLFHRSILENIRYGNLEATDEEVITACKNAHAHDFIKMLPDGYATMVGERGLKLSGGQRQRLAIARAFLKDAPIVLMDEATSALDTVTERAIYQSMQKLLRKKTAIVIAHRLSTIKSLDKIIVLDQGAIVEMGSHDMLINKPDGHYAKMWSDQIDQDILQD